MSGQKIDLALAFLKSQPASAASVLEQQSAEHVASFLRDIPHEAAVSVLKKMLPQHVANICKHLEPAVPARWFAAMDVSLVAATMRRLDNRSSKTVLERLPERVKIACRLLLHYDEEAVGAWMLPNIPTLPDDCTAREAIARLASEQDIVDADGVPIVDRERKLQGVVGLIGLLRAAPEKPILSIARKPDAIPGRATLASMVGHPAWARGDTVAVVDRYQRLVGLLRHVDLRKGLDEAPKALTRTHDGDPLVEILEVYGSSLSALFNTFMEAAGTRRSRGENR